jgi:hypothetical protein
MTARVLDSHLHLIDPCHLDYPWIKRGDDLDQSWHPPRFAAEVLQVTAAIFVEAGVAPARWVARSPGCARKRPVIRGSSPGRPASGGACQCARGRALRVPR